MNHHNSEGSFSLLVFSTRATPALHNQRLSSYRSAGLLPAKSAAALIAFTKDLNPSTELDLWGLCRAGQRLPKGARVVAWVDEEHQLVGKDVEVPPLEILTIASEAVVELRCHSDKVRAELAQHSMPAMQHDREPSKCSEDCEVCI